MGFKDVQMSRIEDVQRRVYTAIGRIEQGLEKVGGNSSSQGETQAQLEAALAAAQQEQAKLADALETSRQAEQSLQEALASEQERVATLSADLESLRAEKEKQDAELEAAKTLSDSLSERVELQKIRLRRRLPAISADLETQKSAIVALDAQIDQLRKANSNLREVTQDLRDANEAGVADPELVNQALKAELEALRAQHATDTAEREVILGQLNRLLDPPDLSEPAMSSEEVS